jgi:hypothetical protein
VLERLGFELTATQKADGEHARIILEQTYLEVRPGPAGTPMRATGWFLRADEQEALRRRLRQAGFSACAPTPYAGVDGRWVDFELPGPEPITPTITRRVDVAGWPPAAAAPHPNGASRVVALRLKVQDPDALTDLLEASGAQAGADGSVAIGDVRIEILAGRTDAILAIAVAAARGGDLLLEFGDDAD